MTPLPQITTPVRLPSARVMELFRKDVLTPAERSEWEALTADEGDPVKAAVAHYGQMAQEGRGL